MTAVLARSAIDLGIVVTDRAPMLAFYRDLIGMTDLGERPMPGGTIHRLKWGESVIKLIVLDKGAKALAPPGGLRGATGYRYWTMTVSNIDQVIRECSDRGVKVAVPITELQPGAQMAIVEDPEGNWVEFVSGTSTSGLSQPIEEKQR